MMGVKADKFLHIIITDCEIQKDMKRLAGARSICLDAYGTDSAGKKYDLEVQRQDKGAYPLCKW